MKNLKVNKKAAALFLAGGFVFSSLGGFVTDLVYDKNSSSYSKNEIGRDNINPFFSYKVNDNNFVILDVGDHNNIGKRFQNKRMELCNKEDISLGIMVTTNSKKENDIYDDVEYVKGLLCDYDVSFPVYLNIDSIITDDSLGLVMKKKIIKDFLEKCSANNIYVGIAGTDSNLCRFEEYIGLTGYDAYLIMDDEEVKYSGTCNVIKDLEGNIIAKEDLSKSIKAMELNNEDNFVQDGSYVINSEAELIDLSLQSGMSEKELLKFNDIRKGNIEEGTVLRIPTRIDSGNDGTSKKVILDEPIVGCDMSYAQGTNQNWSKLKENFDFIILKCCQGTEIDSCFEENAKNCNTYNIPMGVYCYNNYSLSNCNGINDFIKKQNDQVEYTLDTLKNKKIDFPVYLDIEASNGVAMNDYLSPKYVSAMLDIWDQKVGDAGYTPGIYCNYSGYEYLSSCVDYDLCDKFEVWVAGGDQYTSSKTDIPFEDVLPSNILQKDGGIKMVQSTDSAVGAGAGNGRGHLDINFSLVDYEIKPLNEFEIKEFNKVDYGMCSLGAVFGGGLLLFGRFNRRKRINKAKKKTLHK